MRISTLTGVGAELNIIRASCDLIFTRQFYEITTPFCLPPPLLRLSFPSRPSCFRSPGKKRGLVWTTANRAAKQISMPIKRLSGEPRLSMGEILGLQNFGDVHLDDAALLFFPCFSHRREGAYYLNTFVVWYSWILWTVEATYLRKATDVSHKAIR